MNIIKKHISNNNRISLYPPSWPWCLPQKSEQRDQSTSLFPIPPRTRTRELMREVASSTHHWVLVVTLIAMKIFPAAQWAPVSMATFQQHHSHTFQQRSKTSSTRKEGFLKDTLLSSSHWQSCIWGITTINLRSLLWAGVKSCKT